MERTSNGLLLHGIFTLLFGIAAIFWPGLTLVTFVYLFSAYVLLSGVVTLVSGIGNLIGSGQAILTRFLTLIFGVIQIGVGVYLVRHLDVSFATLILLIGFTFIIRGIFDVVTGLFEEGQSGYRLVTIVIGILAALAGIMILFQPVAGGVAFVWILGIYSLVAGPLLIAAAMNENQTRVTPKLPRKA